MCRFLALLSLLYLSFFPITVYAEEREALSIIAVVNDDVITSADLQNRIAFVLLTTGLSNTPETVERLKPQLLRQLIDEQLQLQEAARNSVVVNDADIMQTVVNMEQNRGIPSGMLLGRLRENGIAEKAFTDQVRAQLAWTKVGMKQIRPKVRVSEEEVDRARLQADKSTQMVPASGATEVEISVLTLPVEKPEQDKQVRALADKLVSEVANGVAFEDVARELGGAGRGGAPVSKPFWIEPTALDGAVSSALEKIEQGKITSPIRTQEGYLIVKLLNRRGGSAAVSSKSDNEVLLKEILLRLKEDAPEREVEAMLQIGKEVGRHPGNCTDKGIAGMENVADFNIETTFRRSRTSDFSDALKPVIDSLTVGSVSQPFATAEGIRLFMLCERLEAPPKLAARDETYNRLLTQKLELEAQKFMRNLRREAFVDIRI